MREIELERNGNPASYLDSLEFWEFVEEEDKRAKEAINILKNWLDELLEENDEKDQI